MEDELKMLGFDRHRPRLIVFLGTTIQNKFNELVAQQHLSIPPDTDQTWIHHHSYAMSKVNREKRWYEAAREVEAFMTRGQITQYT